MIYGKLFTVIFIYVKIIELYKFVNHCNSVDLNFNVIGFVQKNAGKL